MSGVRASVPCGFAGRHSALEEGRTGSVESGYDAFGMNDGNEDDGSEGAERDVGEQPIARLLTTLGLSAHDLVAASREQLTHKMVRRGCKGRRLTPRVQLKLLNALNARTAGSYALADLFDYGEHGRRARRLAGDSTAHP